MEVSGPRTRDCADNPQMGYRKTTTTATNNKLIIRVIATKATACYRYRYRYAHSQYSYRYMSGKGGRGEEGVTVFELTCAHCSSDYVDDDDDNWIGTAILLDADDLLQHLR